MSRGHREQNEQIILILCSADDSGGAGAQEEGTTQKSPTIKQKVVHAVQLSVFS